MIDFLELVQKSAKFGRYFHKRFGWEILIGNQDKIDRTIQKIKENNLQIKFYIKLNW